MYVLLTVLMIGTQYQVKAMPVLFADEKSCLVARYEYEQMLEQTKPEGGAFVTRCVDMKQQAVGAAPLGATPLHKAQGMMHGTKGHEHYATNILNTTDYL